MPTPLPPNPKKPPSQSRTTTELLICPACGKTYRPGELVCTQCDTVFDQAANTPPLFVPSQMPIPVSLQAGMLVPGNQQSITCEIDGQTIPLPKKDTVMVGRTTNGPGEWQLDVDLSAFGALEKGVSRRHLTIRCDNGIVFASDLGSKNGTWLNGRRLVSYTMSLLHDGDELRLGELRIKVRF